MKIAMIIEAWEPIWGGGQAHVLELSKKLSENHNCEIDIFTMNFSDEDGKKQDKIKGLNNSKIRIIRAGKIRRFGFKDRILWIPEVIREISKNHKIKKYSLIHAHSNLPGIPGKILNKISKIPVVYTVHGSNFMDLGKKNFFYFVEKIIFTKIKYDQEISVSKNLLDYKNSNRAVWIPNGVDMEKSNVAYANYIGDKNNSVFKILFVGRLDKVKGIDILLASLSSIKKQLKDKPAKINIIGYGYDKSNLEELAKKLDLEDIVVFRGKIIGEKLLKEYILSDLFVLPSRSEGSPLTIFEAWAARIPVIATDVGDNKFFVENNENGYLIPSENPEALAKTILEAMDNKKLSAMGEKGFEMIKNDCTWDIAAEKTFEVYNKVLK